MTEKPDVTITMVNWNTRDELHACLETVLGQQNVSVETIVVDNASTDGSVDMLRSEFAGRVILIENDHNSGFAAGQNAAIKSASGRFVMLLNPDSRLPDEQTLRVMVDFMESNPDVGMLGPRILNPDGSMQFSARRFPTMFAASFRHTILGKLFPKNRFVKRYMMVDWNHDQIADVDWLSGSALMARRSMIDQIGLLDERFFMYCEDVDWCKRAHLGEWRVVYLPATTVTHRIGAASDRKPVEMIHAHHQSMLRYFLKYNSRSPRILLTPLVLLGLWVRSRSRMALLK